MDCQTTGAGQASLLELGWTIACADDSDLKVRSFLVKQPEDAPLSRQIMRLTGISAQDMEEARESSWIFQEFDRDLKALPSGASLALAHFAQFEESFLKRFYESEEQQFPLSFVCTCQIAKRLYPDLPSRSLRAVAGYFGFNLHEEKRAAAHVELTHFVWVNLVRSLAEAGLNTWEEFEQWWLSGESRARSAVQLLPLERLKRLNLPSGPGIYQMLGASNAVLYVGKATSLKNRVNSYFRGRKGKNSRLKELISQIFDVQVVETATSLEAALLEQDLIKKLNPPYNRALKEYDRQVEFASRDFLGYASAQTPNFPQGPFPANTIQPFIDLFKALQGEAYVATLLYEPVAQETVDLALEQLREELRGQLGTNFSCRSLLAHVLARVRLTLNEERRLVRRFWQLPPEERQAFAEEHFLEEEEVEPEEEITEDEVRELSVEDVLRRFYGILFRLARALFTAGQLTRQLNSSVEFTDLAGVAPKSKTAECRRLEFLEGALVASASLGRQSVLSVLPANIEVKAVFPYCWSGVEALATFDRMRVLQAELGRVNRLALKKALFGE